MNRWHKGDDEALKSIEKQLGQPIFASFPNDFRKASEAVNLGSPLQNNHNNALHDRYRQLAAQLAGISAPGPEKKGSLSSIFSFPAKR